MTRTQKNRFGVSALILQVAQDASPQGDLSFIVEHEWADALQRARNEWARRSG